MLSSKEKSFSTTLSLYYDLLLKKKRQKPTLLNIYLVLENDQGIPHVILFNAF